ncbi:TIGR04282 family arsenosugar biosynthesis glycosyltransferase [Aeromicrobium sp.]|uniref:TIGR04282 family arsenosugar biosynthesis glycosyltransferase n=1 Tax=Aeromicrobium sp. TaxID=1871063 RepID=UPI002FCB11B6
MSEPTLLIVAKAPVPGLAKTRIAATIGNAAAADLAAAALLDTLTTAIEVGWPVVVAMTGDLGQAARADQIASALAGCRVISQRGGSLGERLAHAHVDADVGRGVVQVGMDTPQLGVSDYLAAGDALRSGFPVIGPAADGGWWLLGLADSAEAHGLKRVAMSQGDTGTQTEDALGGEVVRLRVVRDMDTWDDALAIAKESRTSRLAHAVRNVEVAA